MATVSKGESGSLVVEEAGSGQEWAIATTKQWSAEVRRELSLEKHRARTTRYRVKRQAKLEAMAEEYRRLEEVLKRSLAAVESILADKGEEQTLMTRNFQRLTLEREILSSQNAELREAFLKNSKFHQAIQKDRLQTLNQDQRICAGGEIERGDIRDSRWIPAPSIPGRHEHGWRVHFLNGEPSFFLSSVHT